MPLFPALSVVLVSKGLSKQSLLGESYTSSLSVQTSSQLSEASQMGRLGQLSKVPHGSLVPLNSSLVMPTQFKIQAFWKDTPGRVPQNGQNSC